MEQILEWAGSMIGIAGAILLALNIPSSKYGFVCFVLSNGCLGTYAWLKDIYPLLVLYLALSAIGLIGVLRWIRPIHWRKANRELPFDIGGHKRFPRERQRNVELALHLAD